MRTYRAALSTLVIASAVALGSSRLPEPMDLAAIVVAATLGAGGVVLLCSAYSQDNEGRCEPGRW